MKIHESKQFRSEPKEDVSVTLLSSKHDAGVILSDE